MAEMRCRNGANGKNGNGDVDGLDAFDVIAVPLGVAIDWEDDLRSFGWDGSTLAGLEGYGRGHARDGEHILHDLAHYAVCPKRRRKEVEFGLGGNPDDWSEWTDPVISKSRAQAEEELASALGIVWDRLTGLGSRYHFSLHGWDEPMNGRAWPRIVAKLRERGLDLTPIPWGSLRPEEWATEEDYQRGGEWNE